ncbi:class I SAM-dependent methyltransferase [Streptomyces sp. NPDC050988]|uniref:class I SAM-dependent methyltransferase n=1 Tax=Streptomyces sp. NPDC050988 TaxID=3365637 RepID=UPI0037B23682
METYTNTDRIFDSAAAFYHVRPGYPAQLLNAVARLASGGRVLDLATGTGVVALDLARRGIAVTAVDPSLEMLDEARRQADLQNVTGIDWRQGTAERLPDGVGDGFAVVTLGDAFHWVNREVTLHNLDSIVRPGGCVALLSHRWHGHPKPSWDAPVHRVRARYLGQRRHAGPTGGQRLRFQDGRHEDILRASAFSDLVHTIADYQIDVSLDDLVTWQFSQIYSSPAVLAEQRDAYERDLRALLAAWEPSGRFRETSQAHLLTAHRPAEPAPA